MFEDESFSKLQNFGKYVSFQMELSQQDVSFFLADVELRFLSPACERSQEIVFTDEVLCKAGSVFTSKVSWRMNLNSLALLIFSAEMASLNI